MSLILPQRSQLMMFDLNGSTSEEDTWRRLVSMVLTFWCRLGHPFWSWVCPGNLVLVRLTEAPRLGQSYCLLLALVIWNMRVFTYPVMGISTKRTLMSANMCRSPFYALFVICTQLASVALHIESATAWMTWNYPVWPYLPACITCWLLITSWVCFVGPPILGHSENMQVFSLFIWLIAMVSVGGVAMINKLS